MTPGAYGTTTGTDERDSRALMEPLMIFSLADEIQSLRSEQEWEENEKNSRTLAKDVDFRALLSVLHSEATIEELDGDARASIQLIEGSAELEVDGDTTRLDAGQLAVVDSGRPWVLRAIRDAAVLVTFAWPIEKAGV
jgi:hypothetical protein